MFIMLPLSVGRASFLSNVSGSVAINLSFPATLGQSQAESVPNVKGSFNQDDSFRNWGEMTGPFYFDGNGSWGDYNNNNKYTPTRVGFDLHRANEVYGRRNEVAPKNYSIKIWKRES